MSSSAGIDRAIKKRWDDQQLDRLFRAFWRDPADRKYPVLQDGEARPQTPAPYCVYEKGQPIKTGSSTGTSCDVASSEIEYWTCPIQLRLHAKTPIRGEKGFGRSAKDILRELVGSYDPDGYGVLKAFDDSTGLFDLGGNDLHICTVAGADFSRREDDDRWMWVILFDIQFERRRKIRGVA